MRKKFVHAVILVSLLNQSVAFADTPETLLTVETLEQLKVSCVERLKELEQNSPLASTWELMTESFHSTNQETYQNYFRGFTPQGFVLNALTSPYFWGQYLYSGISYGTQWAFDKAVSEWLVSPNAQVPELKRQDLKKKVKQAKDEYTQNQDTTREENLKTAIHKLREYEARIGGKDPNFHQKGGFFTSDWSQFFPVLGAEYFTRWPRSWAKTGWNFTKETFSSGAQWIDKNAGEFFSRNWKDVKKWGEKASGKIQDTSHGIKVMHKGKESAGQLKKKELEKGLKVELVSPGTPHFNPTTTTLYIEPSSPNESSYRTFILPVRFNTKGWSYEKETFYYGAANYLFGGTNDLGLGHVNASHWNVLSFLYKLNKEGVIDAITKGGASLNEEESLLSEKSSTAPKGGTLWEWSKWVLDFGGFGSLLPNYINSLTKSLITQGRKPFKIGERSSLQEKDKIQLTHMYYKHSDPLFQDTAWWTNLGSNILFSFGWGRLDPIEILAHISSSMGYAENLDFLRLTMGRGNMSLFKGYNRGIGFNGGQRIGRGIYRYFFKSEGKLEWYDNMGALFISKALGVFLHFGYKWFVDGLTHFKWRQKQEEIKKAEIEEIRETLSSIEALLASVGQKGKGEMKESSDSLPAQAS